MNPLLRTVALAAVALTLALTSASVERNVAFDVTFGPLNQPRFYSGNMLLNFDKGTISGTYNDTSVRPRGPLNNRRNVPVSGGLNENGRITLLIGRLTFRGTLSGQTITGSAQAGSSVFTFTARQGRVGNPAQ